MARTKRAPARKRSTRAAKEVAVTKHRSGAIVSDVMQASAGRYAARTKDRAIDADFASVNRIIWEASTGRTSGLVDLYKSSRTRDTRLDAVCRTRVLAMRSRPLVFRAPAGLENDAEAKRFAELTTRIFDAVPGRGDLIGHLGHGALEGFAVAEHRWHEVVHPTDPGRTVVTSTPRWRHSNRFAWNTETVELCRCDPGVDAFPGTPLSSWPGKFITHAPVIGDSDYPWFRGAMRSRAIASVAKRIVMRWWLKGIERWGQPQVWAAIDENLREGVADEVLEALRELSSAWHARFPKGTELNAIPGKMDGAVHDAWVQFHATEDAIAILGQNLTTEVQGGSFAAAQAHMLVRLDYLAADLAALAETILDQWVRPLFRFNGWPAALVPQVDFVLAPKGEITVAHYQAGLYTADEVRAAMGYDPEPDGKGARYFVPAPAAQFQLASSGAQAAAQATPRAEDAVTEVVVGSIWTDTEDGHRLQVVRVADGSVYFVDLDSPNPQRQYRWALRTFTERAAPPAPAADASAGGAGAALPLPTTSKTVTTPSETSSRSRHPLAISLSRP